MIRNNKENYKEKMDLAKELTPCYRGRHKPVHTPPFCDGSLCANLWWP